MARCEVNSRNHVVDAYRLPRSLEAVRDLADPAAENAVFDTRGRPVEVSDETLTSGQAGGTGRRTPQGTCG